MTWILLKKQLQEVFRSYFFNAKKNKARSKVSVILMFVFFVVIMVGVLGGMFTGMAVLLCSPLTDVGMDWLYFLLMTGLSIIMGAFGSVFNTFAGLYLAKDNDLLLSMPIPTHSIITARLLNVYLMGVLYSCVVILPALIVYWVTKGFTIVYLLSGLTLAVMVSLWVLALSCLLGWCVARISVKLKNKSFISVLVALVGLGLYYFLYYKAGNLVTELIANAEVYGKQIKGSAYGLFLLGSIASGNVEALLIYGAGTIVLMALTWLLLSKSFLSIATATRDTARVKYREKKTRAKSAFGALFAKELKHFTASPSYMLNCGLGILLIPAAAVALLIKGGDALAILDAVFTEIPGCTAVGVCALLCMLSAMNDMNAPSVSLEGKSVWILQTLPVSYTQVLWAKLSLQLLLNGIPMLIAAVCGALLFKGGIVLTLLVVVLPLLVTLLYALFDLFIGLKMANLTWTNEITPIKQGGAVAIALFGGWAYAIALGVLYFLVAYPIGPVVYMLLASLVTLLLSLVLFVWLKKRGGAVFAALHA